MKPMAMTGVRKGRSQWTRSRETASWISRGPSWLPQRALLLTVSPQGTANVQLSWLAPHKVRQTIVVGSKRMVVYDDAAVDGAVRIYDRGVDFTEPTNFGEYQLTYRSGDMVVPRLDLDLGAEILRRQGRHFVFRDAALHLDAEIHPLLLCRPALNEDVGQIDFLPIR